MVKKRGQATENAASFIFMLILFFVIYIIILPTHEKANLLQDNNVYGTGIDIPVNTYETPTIYDPNYETPYYGNTYAPSYQTTTIFSETPGKVYPYIDDALIQPLSSINLYINQEQKTISLAENIQLHSNLFSNKEKTLIFSNNQELQEAKLYFFPTETDGKLTIKLNGISIYEGVPTSSTLPINLPTTYLRSTNRITFKINKPALFGSNNYELKDIKIVLTEQANNQQEQRTFTLNEQEYKNIQGISINYFTNCQRIQDRGTLKIYLNNKLVDERIVVCEVGPILQDLPLDYLKQGTNTLTFSVDQGSYILEQLYLEKYLSQKTFQHYTFSIQPNQYQAVANSYVDAKMRIHMKQDYRKEADIIVNGITYYIDTYDQDYDIDISDSIQEGTNNFRIIPANEFDILNLDILLEE
ncbi:MAG: hypothetical protein Q7R56_03360 [Nanoarchaeota archaeon]|nr:hypothetical protein [Nanoarchaeota archaeon]